MKYFVHIKTTGFLFGLLIAIAFLLSACSTVPRTKQERTSLKADAALVLSQAKAKDSTLSAVLKKAAGYAVFPSISKGGLGVGGAFGQGLVYKDGNMIGYTSVSQATIGFQLGGQVYSEILIFSTPVALLNFKAGNLEFSAQATATALQSGAAADAKYAHGVSILTLDHKGLMYEASIGGQKFTYVSK